MATLRNEDYTDRELLHVIADVCDRDAEGVATSEAIAAALGIGANGSNRSPGGKVATRLAWMARYGFLEAVDPHVTETHELHHRLWRVSEVGEQIMGGKLTKPVETALERMDAGSQVLMMRVLTQRGYVNARPEIAAAVRREYLHQAARRR